MRESTQTGTASESALPAPHREHGLVEVWIGIVLRKNVSDRPPACTSLLRNAPFTSDGHFSREFGTDENIEERSWKGQLAVFAGAIPDIDSHYSLFQKLGERFLRVRWPRASGVEAGLQAIEHNVAITQELRALLGY